MPIFGPSIVSLVSQNPSDLLGYSGEATGTVTQLVNKSTPVTINKPCGRIITANVALNGGAFDFFTVNNSVITQYDNVFVTLLDSSAYPVVYQLWTENVINGAFSVVMRNLTGIAQTHPSSLMFIILKEAIA